MSEIKGVIGVYGDNEDPFSPEQYLVISKDPIDLVYLSGLFAKFKGKKIKVTIEELPE